MSLITDGFNIFDLPKGTVVEIDGEEYELAGSEHPDWVSNSITRDASGELQNVKIISVPWEVTRKIAEWLDNVYTKAGTPENLIIEAGEEIKKDKHTPHISDRPKKG